MVATIKIEQLSNCSLFSGLNPEQLEKIKNLCSEKQYRENEDIIRENEISDDLYLLLEGRVEVSKSLTLLIGKGDIDNREKSFMQLKAENVPFFGEMSLVREGMKRTASIKALESCKVGIINKNDLLSLCKNDPLLGFYLFKNIANTLADRLEKANKDILKLTTAFSFALQD